MKLIDILKKLDECKIFVLINVCRICTYVWFLNTINWILLIVSCVRKSTWLQRFLYAKTNDSYVHKLE